MRPRARPEAGAPSAGVEIESVSALTLRIKALLESSVAPCWVRGEISNLRAQASGHFYFSLKDADSQIGCVMFRGDAARGSAAALRDGAEVAVFGEISVYPPRGNYQLVVRVALEAGLGRLQQEFERLKQRLAAEGLFDAARKKPIPAMPQTVGFVTSPTGAAVQDFIRIVKRRHWCGRLVVLPAKVQGEGAAASMIAALELAQRLAASEAGPRFDLLVLGRGGGSLEDLWAFNEEPLVRAVAACAIPTVSAVGHEIDFTLCDFAADRRAETPSAAAELITSSFLDGVERLRQAMAGLDAIAEETRRARRDRVEIARGRLAALSPRGRVEQAHLRLDDLANRLAAAARHALQVRRQQLGEFRERLGRVHPELQLRPAGERLRAAGARLRREGELLLVSRRQALARCEERLAALGPEAVLRRGYAILRDSDRRPVVSRAAIKPGQRLSGQFFDGEAPLRAE